MEIVVASGKGGTGKTFISSNLACFLHKNTGSTVAVDTDAEAPDLLIALGGSEKNLFKYTISVSRKARIDHSKCLKCYRCIDVCRFKAIEMVNGYPVVVEEYCEGCGACSIVCTAKCIEFYTVKTGVVRGDLSSTGVPVVTADLEVGGRNTGELVYHAKEEAYRLAEKMNARYIVVDSAPGIGCPVISSLAGANILVVVVEPTPPSIRGAKRLLELAQNFNIESYMIINKHDPALDSRKIASELDIEVLGVIPYSDAVVESYAYMKPLLLHNPSHRVSRILSSIFNYMVECVLK